MSRSALLFAFVLLFGVSLSFNLPLAQATGEEKVQAAIQGPAPEPASPEFGEADPRESNIRGLPMGLLRRVVVFPLSAPTSLKDQAEKGWWRSREVLTENRRFLIASRRFMVQKDVYQSRESLTPADAILLGRLLDAHALITFRLKDRTMKMSVSSGEDGLLIWEREHTLHPSLPIAEQIEDASEKLSRDFIANMPYQGFQILDPLIGSALYEEGDVQLAKVDIGPNARVTAGDQVQWIEMERLHPRSLFKTEESFAWLARGRSSRAKATLQSCEFCEAGTISAWSNAASCGYRRSWNAFNSSTI